MATRTVQHAGTAWTIAHRDAPGARDREDAAAGLPPRPMTLVVIESAEGLRATQALPVGALEAMTDEELVRLIDGVLKARGTKP